MTRVILVRHGNTFRPEDTPVWVGARSDMPLVEKGIAQAHNLGSVMRHAHLVPDMILTGPLQRTRETATIIADILNMSPKIKIDSRLTEIDYGAWEGLSTTEIVQSGGGDELMAWDKQAIFPITPGWNPSETQLQENAASVLREMTGPLSLIITSNGILRFFARLASNRDAFPDRKVATGHICVMERDGDDWRIIVWNQNPDVLKG